LEIIAISSILLLLFGPTKLPELSRGITRAIREIRNIFREPDPGEKEERKES